MHNDSYLDYSASAFLGLLALLALLYWLMAPLGHRATIAPGTITMTTIYKSSSWPRKSSDHPAMGYHLERIVPREQVWI